MAGAREEVPPPQHQPLPPAGSGAGHVAAARSELRREPELKDGVHAATVTNPSQRREDSGGGIAGGIGGGREARLHPQQPLLLLRLLRARIRWAILLATVVWFAAAWQGLASAGLYSTINPTATSGVVASTAVNVIPDPLPMELLGIRPRAFLRWGNRGGHNESLPCFPPQPDWRTVQRGPTRDGFVFVKPIKAGSSTAAGVNLRIARGTALRKHRHDIEALHRTGRAERDLPPRYTMCKTRSDHVPVSYRLYGALDRKRSFLWTVLRDPTERAVSMFFHFLVSRRKVEPTDANLDALLANPSLRHYYLQMLSLQKVPDESDTNAINATEFVYRRFAQNIVDMYDFVGVTERMDESLVALSMLLNVPLSDVLYLPAKRHGGWDDGPPLRNHTCTYIWPSFVSEGMRASLNSPMWRRFSRWDQALHRAANLSLDYTIGKTLGRDAFEAQLALYRSALRVAQDRCTPNATFPCTKSGTYLPSNQTDCLWLDSGCGTLCLDGVSRDLGLL